MHRIASLHFPTGLCLGLTLLLWAGASHAQTTTSEPPPPAPQLGPAEPSKDARDEIGQIQRALDQVDSLLLQNHLDDARRQLDDAQKRFDVLRETKGNEVPLGYVPGFVLEERLGALRQQIDEKAAQP